MGLAAPNGLKQFASRILRLSKICPGCRELRPVLWAGVVALRVARKGRSRTVRARESKKQPCSLSGPRDATRALTISGAGSPRHTSSVLALRTPGCPRRGASCGKRAARPEREGRELTLAKSGGRDRKRERRRTSALLSYTAADSGAHTTVGRRRSDGGGPSRFVEHALPGAWHWTCESLYHHTKPTNAIAMTAARARAPRRALGERERRGEREASELQVSSLRDRDRGGAPRAATARDAWRGPTDQTTLDRVRIPAWRRA